MSFPRRDVEGLTDGGFIEHPDDPTFEAPAQDDVAGTHIKSQGERQILCYSGSFNP
jgi:hypothetical protein